MLRCVAESRVVEEVVVAAQDALKRTAPMELSRRTCPTGEAVVDLGGELDILSAEVAVSYVRDVIDRHCGPVMVNLTALAFCDARGLAALVRMAGYAEQKGCPFRLASPNPSLVKLMRITGLDRRFLTSGPKGALTRGSRAATTAARPCTRSLSQALRSASAWSMTRSVAHLPTIGIGTWMQTVGAQHTHAARTDAGGHDDGPPIGRL
jgi:anti-anti-sigma factor